jgi:hypothetical protein
MGLRGRLVRFWTLVALLGVALAAETLWLAYTRGIGEEAAATKRAFVAWTALPDLAVATEARFLRFRSLSDVYSPFNEGPELLDYFPATFTYAPSPAERKMPSRIQK